MIPRQSTESREPHAIRAIHPHPYTEQASRPTREGDGNRKERKNRKNGNHGTSEATNLLLPVVPHHLIRTPCTRQHQADRHRRPAASIPHRLSEPPAIIRSASLPRPPCRRAGRDETASKQRATHDNVQPQPLLSLISLDASVSAGDKQSHGNRDRHGTPRT